MLDFMRSLIQRARPAKAVFQNQDTILTLEQTATDRRFECLYRPTYQFDKDFINESHRSIGGSPLHEWGMIDVGIDGWLIPADALKLYELGYFATGDMLELGTYRGLSTSILARALADSGRSSSLVTIDLDPLSASDGPANLARLAVPGKEDVSFVTGDAITFVDDLAAKGTRYSFAFVDHSHMYEHVLPICKRLHQVIQPGGFVLFHDYNDPRNANPSADDYGVYQGVSDGLSSDHFENWGVFGCTGLFRRSQARG